MPPVPTAIRDCSSWNPFAGGIALRAQERPQPLHAIRLHQEQPDRQRQEGHHGVEQVLEVQPCGEDHQRGDGHDRERGAVVGLDQDERGDPADDQHDRKQRIAHLVDAVHAPLEQRGREEDRGQLRELGRLNPEPADAEPPARAVDLPHEQHGHEREPYQAERRPDERRLLPGAVVHPHDDAKQGEPERRPHRLLHQEEVGPVKSLQRDDRRGAVHHDDARQNEQQSRQEQQLVRLQLSRHTSVPRITGKGPGQG